MPSASRLKRSGVSARLCAWLLVGRAVAASEEAAHEEPARKAAHVGHRALPNPTLPSSLEECSIERPAYVCDPDGILGPGALRVALALDEAQRNFTMPCRDGTAPLQIGVAAVHEAHYPLSRATPLSEAGAVAAAASVIDSWGVGDPRCNHGVALVLAVAERKVGIKTGPGSKARLTDAEVQDIIRAMRPLLRSEAYAEAVVLAVGRIASELGQPPQRVPWDPQALLLGAVAGAYLLGLGWRRAAFRRQVGRINKALAAAEPRLAHASLHATCDVCLREETPGGTLLGICRFACGHALCMSCRWRFAPVAGSAFGGSVRGGGWSTAGSACPVCARAGADADAGASDREGRPQ